ncbi:His/Glu/Gln/Arg/opine family amino acid ABC transporter permease subunit|uniref:His/Glu/Gln/Arg/opine family amino acid ABC transporter permease subunit n=2 Tax=Enterobacterales TaxID=91347 RepID=A0A366HZ72_9GAMM|nr:His/Glu/Gln/Arg/opine family amino acid ABC transporter permease subunit [Brenneria salicis ATCC 15712 = DSM 30166]RBP58107.1 His/Glu/Gln/Arg/opine family amino acid ABC transporter permease subunit [Brenneria salicis ATCC 15712 = DSM 30166]
MQFDWSVIWPSLPLLLEGAKMTLLISVLGLLGGLIIGVLAGFARAYGGWFSSRIALVFIEIIRGTPIVVQVMFIYFALPMILTSVRIDPFAAAVVTIMINSGAYIAEITRGSVLSIHNGFREAGLALGLSRRAALRYCAARAAPYVAAAGQPVDYQYQGYLTVHRDWRGGTDPFRPGDHRRQLPRPGDMECGRRDLSVHHAGAQLRPASSGKKT